MTVITPLSREKLEDMVTSLVSQPSELALRLALTEAYGLGASDGVERICDWVNDNTRRISNG